MLRSKAGHNCHTSGNGKRGTHNFQCCTHHSTPIIIRKRVNHPDHCALKISVVGLGQFRKMRICHALHVVER